MRVNCRQREQLCFSYTILSITKNMQLNYELDIRNMRNLKLEMRNNV